MNSSSTRWLHMRVWRVVFTLLSGLLCLAMTLRVDVAYAQSPLDGFAPNLNGDVHALGLQPDGKILVGGAFTQIGENLRNRLARFDISGAFDSSLDANINGAVLALAVQDNGQIVVGGDFTSAGGMARSYLARLATDGGGDSAFNPAPNAAIHALLLLEDGSLLVAGEFTAIGGQGQGYLARLDSTGALDPTFAPTLNGAVYALALQRDGAIVIGGAFTAVDGQPRRHIARLGSDGQIDAGFAPEANATVRALAIGFGDAIIVGGDFTQIGGVARMRFALLGIGGAPAAATPAFDGAVHALLVQPDGRIWVGGDFTQFSGQPRLRLARFLPDGVLDATFAPSANNDVRALVIQPDGKIVVAGSFTQINGQDYSFIARLDANGALDSSFARFVDESVLRVLAIALQVDGKLVVAIEPRNSESKQPRLVRLNQDGSIDASFQNTIDNHQVASLALQPDGAIIACGDFEIVGDSGAEIFYLARVQGDGALDETYTPDLARCFAVLIQADGRVVAGTILPNPRRFNGDGSTDATFTPNIADGYIFGLARQTDGKLIVVNNYTDGDQFRSRILRLDNKGALDPSFSPRAADDTVFGVALQKDGKIVVAGAFATIEDPLGVPQLRSLLARLSTTTLGRQSIDIDSSGAAIAWRAQGVFPEFASADFAYSTDGVTYTSLGSGRQMGTAWQLSGVSLPFNREFLVRARGGASSGGFNTSTGRIDSIGRAFIPGGSIEVATLVSPTQIAPHWVVDVNGNSAFSATLTGAATTGVREVGLGVYTMTLRAVSETVQADYIIAHTCTIDGEVGPSGEGNMVQAAVTTEGEVRCRFSTNRRTAALEVRHVISPTAAASVWDLSVAGPTLYTATLVGDASTGVQIVFTGAYTVDLIQRGGASYTTTYQCNTAEQPVVSGEGAQAMLTVLEGQTVLCNFRSILDAPRDQLFLPFVIR